MPEHPGKRAYDCHRQTRAQNAAKEEARNLLAIDEQQYSRREDRNRNQERRELRGKVIKLHKRPGSSMPTLRPLYIRRCLLEKY